MADPARPAAIEDLLEHSEWLSALAKRLVASEDIASDIEQETWLAALEHPPRDAFAPRQWLAHVLRNVVRQHHRSESARLEREARAARREPDSDSQESVERAQSLRALIDAVLELDEPYRSTLLLRYQDGLSTEAIAAQQGLPGSTVRNRVSRGLAQLRERLARRHGETWSALLVPLLHHEAVATAAAAAGGISVLAAFTSMATLKLVTAAIAVLAVAGALWWKFSEEPVVLVGGTEAIASPASPALNLPEKAGVTRAVAAVPVGETQGSSSSPTAAGISTRGSLDIRVTWEADSSPASDVGLWVLPWGETRPFAFRSSHVTDAQGHVHVDGVASGRVAVGTDRAGGDQVSVNGGETAEVALSIPRGILVRGRTLDETGAPVGFARVWLSDHGNPSEGGECASSDAAGRFTLRDVGESRRIAAFAAGFQPSLSLSVNGKPGDAVEIALELQRGGAELRGVVRAPDGRAVSGASLLVYSRGKKSVSRVGLDRNEPSASPPQHLFSDELGEFSVSGLWADSASVLCRARDCAPYVNQVALSAEKPARFVVELRPGAAITGAVRDSFGKPANKVRVQIGEYGTFDSSTTTTAPDGSFRFEGLAPGSTTVVFRGDLQGDAERKLLLVAGETAQLEVQLVKQGLVAGRLIDESGAPLAGWRVGAIESVHQGLHLRTTITDAAGSFTLDNWPAKADALEVREKDRWSGPPSLLVMPVDIGRADLVLTVPASAFATSFIVGRLAGPDGEVVADAMFAWGEPGSDRKFFSEMDSKTGEFRAGPLPSGKYEFQARSSSMGLLDLPGRDVRAGETLDLGLVQFRAPGRIRVKLVGTTEALERLTSGSYWLMVLGARRLAMGQIELDEEHEGISLPLGAGPYRVEFGSQTLRAPPVSVELAAGEVRIVELEVEPATSRSVLIQWESGAPPKEQFELVLTDSSGREVVESLPAMQEARMQLGLPALVVGTYSVAVHTTDGRSGRAEFAVDDLTPVHRPIAIVVQ